MRSRGAGESPNSALLSACERALARSARACGAGTRQQVRAAARRFVRRHRRDAGYLAWVLRSASASSALAVTLLGLSTAPASAEMAPYRLLTGAANPLAGHNVFSGVPSLADLDGDGDPDLVVGRSSSNYYFENTGSAESPAFTQRTGAANPLAYHPGAGCFGDLDGDGDFDRVAKPITAFDYYVNGGSATSPLFNLDFLPGISASQGKPCSLSDLDGDGDLDFVTGEGDGTLGYFENTGNATGPAFVSRTGSANPLAGHAIGYPNPFPSLADLDRDGDLDLVSAGFGSFLVFENTGSAVNPTFVQRTGTANPFDGQSLVDVPTTSLGDLDGDGDFDLVATLSGGGSILTFEHLGGELVARTGAANPLDAHDVGVNSYPSLGDLDGDGDLDAVVGEYGGQFFYFQNTGNASSPIFAARTGAANPMNGQDAGNSALPTLGDLDDDGDLDLVAGTRDSGFHYYENTGSVASPAFVERIGAANPLAGFYSFYGTPTLGDLDGDGDLDVVIGSAFANLRYLRNTGSAASPVFVEQTGSANPFDGIGVLGARLSLGDVDGDLDLDLVSGGGIGAFRYFENSGSAATPTFAERTGKANPLDGHDVGDRSAPSLGDLDADGALDVMAGNGQGTFNSFESFIPQILPALQLTGGANPLAGEDVGLSAAPALGDLDGDGDLDLVAGEEYGTFRYFENTGSATSPVFLEQTGAVNPLDGHDVDYSSSASLGDLDGDGDLDLVAGNFYGTFRYLQNTGSATNPAFVEQTGAANPLAGQDEGYNSMPSLADLDGDGDLDLLAGDFAGNDSSFHYYENTGSAVSPALTPRTGVANPLDGQYLGFASSSPALGDFDRDGDLDLAGGDGSGVLSYFKNQGGATAPSFEELTGVANPLAGDDLGATSVPAAGDLDGDGDLDLVTGTDAGTFAVHYFPEPMRGLLLGAGIALLGWLRRLRRPK